MFVDTARVTNVRIIIIIIILNWAWGEASGGWNRFMCILSHKTLLAVRNVTETYDTALPGLADRTNEVRHPIPAATDLQMPGAGRYKTGDAALP